MDFQRLMDSRNANSPFARQLGITIEEISEGHALVSKTVRPGDANPLGIPHGGIYFSLADTACGSAMASHGDCAVTVNANYSFLRGASVGDRLLAEAREVKGGRTLAVFEVRVTGQEGVLLGTGTFTFCRLGQRLEV